MAEQVGARVRGRSAKRAGSSVKGAYRAWYGPALLAGGAYHDGSVVANRLGLQLARIATLNTTWALRRRPVDADLLPHVERYERDGFVVIESFLPDDVFAAVRSECLEAYAAGLFTAEVAEDNAVVEENFRIKGGSEVLAATRAAFAENEWFRRLAAAIGRRPAVERVKIDVNFMTKSKDAPPPTRLVGTNYLHADVHYPSGKAWLYLNDIDEHNGAFVYAKGSQRLRPARWLHEYDASVRTAKAKREGSMYSEVPGCLVRMPTERQVRAMGIVESVVSGPANTLVFANVMGFHRRGEFDEGRRREQVQILFADRPRDRPSR